MQEFFSTLPSSRTLRQLGSIACAALFLVACSSGGGDGGGGTSPAASSSSGTFVDSPVQGLGYQALPSGFVGKTDATGQYQYMSGDTVSFNLGGRPIGLPVTAVPQVTALSIFGATSVSDPSVVNLSRLLLTLGGPPNSNNNVIQLPSPLPGNLPPTLPNFSDLTFATELQRAGYLLTVSDMQAATHLDENFSTLSVTLDGSGSVTSNPTGLNCGATCSADFPNGTSMTITATGAGFTGWSGGCSGTMTTCVVNLTADTSMTASFDSTATDVVYPLRVGPTGRYLVDQNGATFPILGRTAWFITSLSETDYKTFIDDTAAKGYNAIEFHVVNHDPRGNHPPFDGTGTLPFTKRLDGSAWGGSLSYGNINNEAPDFSQPNETYWTHVDALLAYAESKGVLCFMFPAYAGFAGGDQGWMSEMTANGTSKMQTYGAFITNRYMTQGNIVWMLGGDYGTGGFPFIGLQLDVEKAMLVGMQTALGASRNFSAEWNTDSIYTDQADATLRAAGTLEGAYSHNGDVNIYARNGYAHSPIMPTFLLEEPYDEEGPDGNRVNPSATQPVRRFQWWGWLSGIGGYIAGNGYVWPFNTGWQAHLNTQGAQDMARLNTFVRSIAWHNLVPSGLGGMKTLVTAGNSSPSSSNYVAAAASPDGTLLVAYVPPDHSGSITIDMTAMSGLTRARWFDPTTAVYTDAGIFPPPLGSQVFTPPSVSHVDTFTDWVLLLEKQ